MGLNIPYSNRVSGAGIAPAPDLAYPDNAGANGYIAASLTTSSSLSTALSLTGKFIIDHLKFLSMTAESTQIKLTVDGVIIWDDTSVSGTESNLLGFEVTGNRGVTGASMQCEASFLLELSKATDTAVTLHYLARPIL